MKRSLVATVVLSLLVANLTGCGTQATENIGSAAGEIPSAAEMAGAKVRFASGGDAPDDGVAATPAFATAPAGLNRKIIYDAEIELVVEDFDGMGQKVIELVKQFDAYVADSDFSGASGDNRRGKWKIRVPVDRFEEFIPAAKGLGELLRAGTSSRDVSEEYYDVDARIRNKTKEEARLLKLLEERPGKLEDVIAIERELSRVREELERMQGRLRVLADLTSMTTVEVTIVEIRDYEPTDAPTLATRVRRSFAGSAATLISAGEGLLLAGVAAAPWLPVLAVVLAPAYLGLRRARRPRRGGDQDPGVS